MPDLNRSPRHRLDGALTIDAARPLSESLRTALRTQSDGSLAFAGYGLITAELVYAMPDYPNVLNTFLFQDRDRAGDFPRLFDFLMFWDSEIEGRLRHVRYDFLPAPAPTQWRREI